MIASQEISQKTIDTIKELLKDGYTTEEIEMTMNKQGIRKEKVEEIIKKASEKKTDFVSTPAMKKPETIQTKIDEIYKFVLSKDKIKLKEVSDKFKIDATTLTKWLEVLQKKQVIELKYPLVGGVYIRKKVIKNE